MLELGGLIHMQGQATIGDSSGACGRWHIGSKAGAQWKCEARGWGLPGDFSCPSAERCGSTLCPGACESSLSLRSVLLDLNPVR